MRWKSKHTGWAVVAAIVVIAVTDIVLMLPDAGLTYSEVVRVRTWEGHLWMPLMWGVIGGHWFARERVTPRYRPLWLLPINLPLILLGSSGVLTVPWWLMLGTLIAGIPLGWYLWGQRDPAEIKALQEEHDADL